MAGPHVPLSTLRNVSRDMLRMTRGQRGLLVLRCKRLALFTPCRSPGALTLPPGCRGRPAPGHDRAPAPPGRPEHQNAARSLPHPPRTAAAPPARPMAVRGRWSRGRHAWLLVASISETISAASARDAQPLTTANCVAARRPEVVTLPKPPNRRLSWSLRCSIRAWHADDQICAG
jgi:hypothetical protein